MAKQIKHFRQLPHWFQLEKYDAAKDLDLFGWWEQFAVRKYIRMRGGPLALEVLRETPIVDSADGFLADPRIPDMSMDYEELPAILRYRRLSGGALPSPQETYGVRFVTVGDHFLTHLAMDEERRKQACEFFGQLELLESDQARDEFQDWFDHPVRMWSPENVTREIWVSVDMMLPDRLLIDSFKRLLKELRGSRLPEPERGNPDPSEWIRLGVLPYIDLRAWEQEEGVSIVRRVMADAIFPLGEESDDTVRTTAKCAEERLSEDQLKKLEARAMEEQRNGIETGKERNL